MIEDNKTTTGELETHLSDLKARMKDMAAQYADRDMPADAEAEWSALRGEIAETEERIGKRLQREAELRELSESKANIEDEQKFAFQTRRASSVIPSDPHDLEAYHSRTSSLEDRRDAYREGAMKILDDEYRHQESRVSREEVQGDLEKALGRDPEVALRMITTLTPKYKREMAEYVRTGQAGPEMLRTASLTTTAGGYAVPVDLDPTVLLTNAGAVNPIRQLARVRQTNVNTVEWINSTGITAGYNNEATEASDNAPTLAQPTANIEKAFAFVPMSIEIASDWANVQGEMAMMFNDAKNRIESTKFLKGLGHASHEPQGLIAAGGATAIVTTATTAVFAVADLFSLEIALSPRYRANASIVGNKAAFQKIRQFASNGVNIWVQLQGANPPELIGYPAYEWSDYDATPTTSGSTILTIGDFSYFGIAERVGMNVEFIPHLFGGSNRYPTGQRGLYAWWRNSTQVLSPTLGANSAFVSLKVL